MKEILSVKQAIADHYGPITANSFDNLAKNFLWGYSEVLQAMAMELVFGRRKKPQQCNKIHAFLDLGVGTGNVSKIALEKYFNNLNTEFHASKEGLQYYGVDNSENMLAKAKVKLDKFNQIEVNFEKIDFKNISNRFSFNQIDCVVAGFSIHHLNDVEKQDLFSRCF